MHPIKKKVMRPSHSGRGALPQDVIALGPKQKSHEGGRSIMDMGILPMKKQKMSQPSSISPSQHQRTSPIFPEPNVTLIDVPFSDLLSKIIDENDFDLVNGMLCGAIKHLRSNRSKPDSQLYCSLFTLAKERPGIFTSSVVVDSLVAVLKKDVTVEYMKSKTNSASSVIACSLLLHAFEISHTWPPTLIKVFIDDSLGDRVWVDNPNCNIFVRNICTVFRTKFFKSSNNEERKSASDDSDVVMVDEHNIPMRFASDSEMAYNYVLDTIKERMSRRQSNIPTQDAMGLQSRNLLKTLACLSGVPEIRVLASQKLEMWLQNPKLVKPTQNLIMSICINSQSHAQEDVDVIGNLTKMRVKNKANLNSYIQSLKELVKVNPDNLSTLFHFLIYNELSASRNPINMTMVGAMLHFKPVESAKMLAIVWQDLLLQHEDYLRASRGLIREIVRSSKYSVHFPSLILGFLQEPDSDKFVRLDTSHKERFINSTVDITCLLMLLSITPAVKEVMVILKAKTTLLTEEQEALYLKHKLDLAQMQYAAIWWLQSIVILKLKSRISQTEFLSYIHKIMFLKLNEASYHSKDNWPPETERSFLIKSCGDVPVLEDTIHRLTMMGLSNDHPLPPAEVLEVLNVIIRRAAGLAKQDFNPLTIENKNLCDLLLSLSQYHHPGNIKLPSDYVPPSLAILILYWNVWRILLILSAFNPSTIGYHGWTNFPTLKNFMEMAIINNFTFPPATVADEQERSVIISKEQQMVQVEKSEILEFESYLAAASTHLAVTEESSLLLTQLIAMDTTGAARRAPDSISNITRALCKDLQLGAWLCRSRNPDFLLDIINRYGDNQQMPWLASVVSSASGDMAMLPVQCLCEFLLAKNTDLEDAQLIELVERLYNILASDKMDEASQILRYFIHRLHLPQLEQRLNARKALERISKPFKIVSSNLNISITPEFEWLLQKLEYCIPVYQLVRKEIIMDIQSAVRCETDPIAVVAYVSFLSENVMKITTENYIELSDVLQSTALAVAQLLIERPVLVDSILSHNYDNIALLFVNSVLMIFATLLGFTRKIPAPGEDQSEDIPWCDTQDEIFVKWPGRGGTAQLHVYVSQAMILLLTYGCPSNFGRDDVLVHYDHLYAKLMNDWFSVEGFILPKAFLMDTQEEAILIPDWLRIKMLYCNTNSEMLRLAVAATVDLDIRQALLCVQSFGIPVPTMERLLNTLDQYAMQTPDEVTTLTKQNAVFLISLVETQWKKGCQVGHSFFQILLANKRLASERPSVIQLTTPSNDNEVVDLTDDKVENEPMEIEKPSLFFKKTEIKMDAPTFDGLFAGGTANLQVNKQFCKLIKFAQKSSKNTESVSSDFVTFLKSDSQNIAKMFKVDGKCSCLLRIIHKRISQTMEKSNQASMETEDSSDVKMKENYHEIIEILQSANEKHEFADSNNVLSALLKSLNGSETKSDKNADAELHQSDWSRLEEFLKQQLASLKKNEEIKEKVDLVAQILLEEIGSRRTKAGRGKGDVIDDKFYTSVGTTGLLIDWLQLLDPELLAHHPKLQRKLIFELQKITIPSMPIKMSAKMSSSNKLPYSLSAHQTYLLSLLADHCNWVTVHQCLKWILSDDTADASSLTVDPNTAMDFLWVCIYMSNIWKGRENKSSRLKEPVLYLNTKQFCTVLSFLVASSTKRPNLPKTQKSEYVHFDLFLLYYNKFGQANPSADDFEEIVMFIYKKSTQSMNCEIWRSLLAQLFLLQPNYSIWDKKIDTLDNCGTFMTNTTIFQSVVSCEVGTLCHTDLFVEKLLDKLGYVRENGKVSTDGLENAIKSSRDEAYDASVILRKVASFRPSILLRQLPLIISMLNGRTRYEFQEFKHKNHLLFISQLGDVLEIIGLRLFAPEYMEYVLTIMECYLQIIKNYCHKARKQTKEIMYCSLRLITNFQATSPVNANSVLSRYTDTLQNLKVNVYKDHEDVITIVSSILANISSASLFSQSTDNQDNFFDAGEKFNTNQPKEYIMPYLQKIAKGQDLETVAQALNELHEPTSRKIRDLRMFLPDLVRLFSTCSDSTIRHAALSLAVQVLKSQPKYAMKIILPAYINCLKCHGNDPMLSTDTSEQFLIPNSMDTDLIARDALTYLPDIVILCREESLHILKVAFAAGTKQSCGIQPIGTMGNIGTPLLQGVQASWNNLEELISKSLSLLSGNIE